MNTSYKTTTTIIIDSPSRSILLDGRHLFRYPYYFIFDKGRWNDWGIEVGLHGLSLKFVILDVLFVQNEVSSSKNISTYTIPFMNNR